MHLADKQQPNRINLYAVTTTMNLPPQTNHGMAIRRYQRKKESAKVS